MEKDVLISIRGTQKGDGEEPQIIELTTDGKLQFRDGDAHVSYVESEVTGLDGVVTTFHVGKDEIVLSREGPLTSTMIFKEGQKNEALYDMGFGALLVGVCAKKVRSCMDAAGGSLFVDYDVEIEHMPVGNNVYEIEFRTIDPA